MSHSNGLSRAHPAGPPRPSGPVLAGGGFGDDDRREIVETFTHDLGHVFDFPHKCGYSTFEQTPGMSCTTNYFHTWLHKLGTHLGPGGREVERFGPGKSGNNFCAQHLRRIRLAHLEGNPAIWKW